MNEVPLFGVFASCEIRIRTTEPSQCTVWEGATAQYAVELHSAYAFLVILELSIDEATATG